MPQSVQQFLKNLGISIPIIQAPMAGVDSPELAIAVAEAGGLGSLACALLSPDDIRKNWTFIRSYTRAPINLNFFCHQQTVNDPDIQERWKTKLLPYYQEFSISADNAPNSPTRAPFDETYCSVIEEIKPEIVSFHFGLPSSSLLSRVKKAGAFVMSSATTLKEAKWLEQNGADAIIAQGIEAGGPRAMFLTDDLSDQPSTSDLLLSILNEVKLPVIAAGGIADADCVQHVLRLGAAAAQIGTAYLFCPEAKVSPLYRQALSENKETIVTNIFSGRPARGIRNKLIDDIGPLSDQVPPFPFASTHINPLRQASEKAGSIDFMQMWSGMNRKPHHMSARDLTLALYKS